MIMRIGINGFGRIGRLILRNTLQRKDATVVAVNNPGMALEYAAYLLTHDTVHGRLNVDIKIDNENNALIINGQSVTFYSEKEPINVPWGKHRVDVVTEASGVFTTSASCQAHLDAGAQKVVITAPAKDQETPTYVMGVNEKNYQPDQRIVSNASCTTNCIAPLCKVIQERFGIAEGLMTTVHAVTATQNTVDGSNKKNWRLGRAAYDNIVPSTTGAAKAVGLVIPELQGKLTGTSLRVPVNNVSVVDLTCTLEKPATKEEICAAIKDASEHEMKGVIAYTEEDVVSSDIIGDSHTCVFDAKASVFLNDHFVKLLAWYDNEWGYSVKTVDLAVHICK
ncbi:MAG: type I glyceraldehyde-3-phosphate dehydrogenase [Clostridia bacterium]|nr:type I glyceraldehyde-3-phosphate dehydrogenase [Clostridia bacterium]